MKPTHLSLPSLGYAVLLATAPAALGAQGSSTAHDSAPSCLMSIPDSALRRVGVFVQAELIDSAAHQPILPGIDLLTQEVASRVRALLGAGPDSVPNGEPAVTWRGLDARLLVVVHRNGQMTSKVSTPEFPSSIPDNMADSAAAHLLARALAALYAEEGYFVAWPAGFRADSVAFHLAVHRPSVDIRGVVTPVRARQGFPLFYVGVPTEESVTVKQGPVVKYPAGFPAKGVTGELVMLFVIDTTGRVDMSTVKDYWPPGRPRLTGKMAEYYEGFQQAIVRALPDTRYEPARIGGCKVRQLVQQPYGFGLNR